MPETPTPGEIVYEAYAAHMPRVPMVTYIPPYGLLEVESRMAWEAAAQAVLTWAQTQQPGTAGWLTAHPPPPLSATQRQALDATLEAFGEEDAP
jgi:hypothetical protein